MKKDAKMICGVRPEEVREAYFEGNLKTLLAKIQTTKGWGAEDIQALGAELERLRAEEGEFVQNLRKSVSGVIPGLDGEAKPPTVDELMEGASDKEWREKADKAAGYIESVLDGVREAVATKKAIPPTFWLDTANVFLSMMNVLDRDLVHKEQLYRARMTRIIDEYGVSRKEAEERARMTPEYAAYKNASLLQERIIEFILLCKKKDAKPF